MHVNLSGKKEVSRGKKSSKKLLATDSVAKRWYFWIMMTAERYCLNWMSWNAN